MTPHPPENMSLGPSADRALAALDTPRGKSRVQRYLERAAPPEGGQALAVDDLVKALRELRRQQ